MEQQLSHLLCRQKVVRNLEGVRATSPTLPHLYHHGVMPQGLLLLNEPVLLFPPLLLRQELLPVLQQQQPLVVEVPGRGFLLPSSAILLKHLLLSLRRPPLGLSQLLLLLFGLQPLAVLSNGGLQ